MARGDWLSGSRGELAADRILDAAGQLFARQSPASHPQCARRARGP
ncbi:MAG TPA: hypothetical protein PLF91_08820, partial [Mycolicibacterium fallax]|nr:hypothetical protein [Mycolicibacterium fallax]